MNSLATLCKLLHKKSRWVTKPREVNYAQEILQFIGVIGLFQGASSLAVRPLKYRKFIAFAEECRGSLTRETRHKLCECF